MEKKNIHAGHRNRLLNQIIKNGLDKMTEVQVLEFILSIFIPRKDTNITAHLLLNEFGSIQKVLDADVSMLTKVEGIGERTAKLLTLLPDIFQVYKESSLKQSKLPLKNLSQVVSFLSNLFVAMPYESLYVLYFNAKQELLGFEKICEGNQNEVLVNIQNLVNSAIKNKATFVIFAHNHPSGEAYPSKEDITTTTKLFKVFYYNDIQVMDHIIIAGDSYYSFNQNQVIVGYYNNTLDVQDKKLANGIMQKINNFVDDNWKYIKQPKILFYIDKI